MSDTHPEALPERFFTKSELARLLRVCCDTLDQWRRKKLLPEPIRLAGGKVLWTEQQVRELLAKGGR